MWHGIAEQLSVALGKRYLILERRALSAEPNERRLFISDGKQPLFIKLAPRGQLDRLTCSQRNLAALLLYQQVYLPEPLCCGIAGDCSFIAMGFIPLQEAESPHWFSLGAALARLHRSNEQAMYGWDEDNYLGLTPQPNRWQKQWSTFFAEQRIGWQLQLLKEQNKLDVSLDIAGVVDTVSRLLAHHTPVPSPLHGDLWRGNCGFTSHQGVLFSPASYFGDRETDLAMTELFGQFPDTFYTGYNSIWPLEPEYAHRKSLYNLYHQLNHYLLFGEGYRQPAEAALKLLLAT